MPTLLEAVMVNYILGLSAFYHDSAACLLKDGEIIAAAEEERFSRVKGDARFPKGQLNFVFPQQESQVLN